MKLALMALRNSAWWVVLGLLEQIQSTSHRVSTASLSIVHIFPIRQDTVLSRKSDHQTLECVLHWLSYIVICGFLIVAQSSNSRHLWSIARPESRCRAGLSVAILDGFILVIHCRLSYLEEIDCLCMGDCLKPFDAVFGWEVLVQAER